jgi:hypothetical protein
MWYALTFILRPSESFRWRADEKFDQRGFSYDHLHPGYLNGFRTLFFITEATVRFSDPLVMPTVAQELWLRYHQHLYPKVSI